MVSTKKIQMYKLLNFYGMKSTLFMFVNLPNFDTLAVYNCIKQGQISLAGLLGLGKVRGTSKERGPLRLPIVPLDPPLVINLLTKYVGKENIQ
jgi:hypothetical protein